MIKGFTPKALQDRVLGAMETAGRLEHMKELWGDEFPALLKYLSVATAPTEVGLSLLQLELASRPIRRTLVLTGERCSGAREDGADSPILQGMAKVAEILAPVSCMQSMARTGREPDSLTLLFSGGQPLTPEMGEIVAGQMACQFNELTGGRFASAVQHEQLSLNTGDQGRVLAALAFSRRVDLVVVPHVVDHIARFAATVAVGLAELVDTENARLDALKLARSDIDPRKIDQARRVMPEFLCVGLGDWDDLDPRRGKGEGIARWREAFGPDQTPEEAVYKGKLLGGEYERRYFIEQREELNFSFACPAFSPSKMLERCIPQWQQTLLLD